METFIVADFVARSGIIGTGVSACRHHKAPTLIPNADAAVLMTPAPADAFERTRSPAATLLPCLAFYLLALVAEREP
jgi:hypothetical protein